MLKKRYSDLVVTVARVLAVFLVLIVVALAGYWLVAGGEVTVVREVPADSNATPLVRNERRRYWPGVLYLVAAVPLLVGLARQRVLPLAWLGLALLSVSSVLLLFSSGAAVLPLAGILLVLIGIIQVFHRD